MSVAESGVALAKPDPDVVEPTVANSPVGRLGDVCSSGY